MRNWSEVAVVDRSACYFCTKVGHRETGPERFDPFMPDEGLVLRVLITIGE